MPQGADSYEEAIRSLRAERQAIASERPDLVSRMEYLEGRDAELLAAEASLIALLPADKRAKYVPDAAVEPQHSARGSVAYDNIVRLFERSEPRSWTAPAIQIALKSEGVEMDLKPVHNVLNYLARSRRLQRISRGRYLVVGYGVGLVTSGDDE